MFRNYLKVAIRNLLRHRVYSAINIVGLAVGMACCIPILLYIQDELSYESHLKNADRIYRVLRETQRGDGESYYSTGAPGALVEAIKGDFPEVEKVVRTWVRARWMREGDRVFRQVICMADPEILDVFELTLTQGDPETALANPGSVLITEKTARKLFGEESPIGKLFSIDNIDFRGEYVVTGVIKDFPENTHLQFDFLTTTIFTDYAKQRWTEWMHNTSWHPLNIYVLASKHQAPESLRQKLNDVSPGYRSETATAPITYHFQPLTRVHLYSARDYGIDGYGDITTAYILSAMTLFIMLIACTNFMSVATARSAQRAREVGLRKVVGAHRRQLVRQFLSETIFLSFLALLLALVFVELILPEFNAFIGRMLSLNAGKNPGLLVGLVGVALVTGVLAGSYPAFFLSGFQPVVVMKGVLKAGTGGRWFRKGLVVFQFAISIFLMIGTVVIHDQLHFIQNKNLGFNKEQVVVMSLFGTHRALNMGKDTVPLSDRFEEVKQAFLRHPGVVETTASRGLPGSRFRFDVVLPEGKEGEQWQMHVVPGDGDFIDFFDIQLVAGRKLSAEIEGDKLQGYVLTEAAVKQLGWTDPIGKSFEWRTDRPRKGTVVGVVKDFHMSSLHEKVEPAVICMQQHLLHWLALKIRPEDVPETLRFVEETWKRFIPGRPFEFFFLDEHLSERYYMAEMRAGQILKVASFLAIFVACLGLFGLAAFTAEQRTKEIGIRKVLGASVSSLVSLLSREFTGLVVVANLIAWPAAYFMMDWWLQDFAYRINLGIVTFLLGGVLTLALALVTVGVLAIRAALANPVDALKYE